MAYYDEKSKKTYCAEDCRYSQWNSYLKKWQLTDAPENYHWEFLLTGIQCCPMCMRRLLSDATTMIPVTWKEEECLKGEENVG